MKRREWRQGVTHLHRGCGALALALAAGLTYAAADGTATDFHLPSADVLLPKEMANKQIWNEITVNAQGLLDAQEVAAITDKYLQHPLNPLREAENLRLELTRACINHGYINSGAVLQEQSVTSAHLVVDLVIGRITQINVQGLDKLRRSYIVERLWPDLQRPLNMNLLQENFQRLLGDPLFKRINSRVEPGAEAGQATLDLQIEEARRWSVFADYDNLRSPTTGEFQTVLGGVMRNLSGLGDSLDFSWNRPIQGQSTSGMALGYSVPLPTIRTIAGISLTQGQATVTAPPFDRLNFSNKTLSTVFSLTQPFIENQADALSAGVEWVRRSSDDRVDGQSFSISLGEPEGHSEVTATRLFAVWAQRGVERSYSLRATYTRGKNNYVKDPFNSDVPQSSYSSALLQGVYNWLLTEGGTTLVARANYQRTPDILVSTERFSPTNSNGVRGYLENQFIFDNAYTTTLEMQFPALNYQGWQVTVSPFVDRGGGHNNSMNNLSMAQTFGSYGLAINGSYKQANFMVTKAVPVVDKNLVTPGYRQSNGWLFQIRLTY